MSISKIICSSLVSINLLFIASSCDLKEKRSLSVNKSDTLFAKSIRFPENLYLFRGGNFYNITAADSILTSKFKIISIVDGSCVKCIISQLNVLDSTFTGLANGFDAKFITILNVKSQDSIYFLKFVYPEIKTKGTVFWDYNFNFERANALFTMDINLRTFLVNEYNQIIQYGSPLVDPDIVHEYHLILNSK